MKFETAEQMLDFINDGNDLYSRRAEVYVFSYNDAGSICTYNIDQDEAKRLSKQVNDSDENYWGAFLGVGGNIWDDPTHNSYNEGQATNLDCCKSLLEYEDWVRTQHYLGEPISLIVQINVNIKEEDIDDIMCAAFEGGINYWCNTAEVVGDYLGEYASEQISRGGTLRLHDMEAEKVYELTLDMFINGFKLWVENGANEFGGVTANGIVDTCNIDAADADAIIQYAIFGEVIYG